MQGTILPGITRRSILELAESRGYTVGESPITLEEALQADEVFTSGTAVVVSPVGSLTHKGQKTQFGKPGVPGMFTSMAWHVCTAIALGRHQCVCAIPCDIDQNACWKELSVMEFHVC